MMSNIFLEVTNLKVIVDQDACIACGICSDMCDEVFEPDELDISQIVEEYRNEDVNIGEVDDDIECVEFAAEDCPVAAIEVKWSNNLDLV